MPEADGGRAARPSHIPYARGISPFSIGLKPLDPRTWIEADEHFGSYLAEKRRLLADAREDVWAAEEDTHAAQIEVRDTLLAHLLSRPGGRWVADGTGVCAIDAGRVVARACLDDGDPHPLLSTAMLVQEDLCLMRRGPGGWRLAAASVSFPSSWSLRDKFGRTLDALHEPVPGYAGTMAARMARVFDNLRVGIPVTRMNWSLYGDAHLHHPDTHGPLLEGRDEADGIDGLFMRVERQTLTKMPESGDLLFTIRIHVDPLSTLLEHREADTIFAGLRAQLARMDEAQLAYKGLGGQRECIESLLRRAASPQ